MALTTLDYVCDVMRQKNYPMWRLKCDGSLVNLYEAKDLEMGISELKKCVANQIGGIIEITISNKTGVEKNEGGKTESHTLKFQIECPTQKGVNGNDAKNDLSQLEAVYRQLAEQKYLNIIQRLEEENEQLKLEIEELENGEDDEAINGNQNIMEQLLNEVKPYIKPMIGKFLGNAMPLQNPSPINENVSEQKPAPGNEQKLTDAQIEQIKKCAAGGKRILLVDEFFGDRVLQLALLAEKDFASYEMACNMLNSMAQKLQE